MLPPTNYTHYLPISYTLYAASINWENQPPCHQITACTTGKASKNYKLQKIIFLFPDTAYLLILCLYTHWTVSLWFGFHVPSTGSKWTLHSYSRGTGRHMSMHTQCIFINTFLKLDDRLPTKLWSRPSLTWLSYGEEGKGRWPFRKQTKEDQTRKSARAMLCEPALYLRSFPEQVEDVLEVNSK